MNLSLRLGRVGPMLISLNYTWLPVGGLGLWILALVWLPPYLNGAPDRLVWALAALTILLYGAALLLAEAVRTRVAGIFSARCPRSVHLCPFGAAVAYPLDEIPAGRAMAVSLVAPLTLGVLGVAFAQVAGWVTAPDWAPLAGILHALVNLTGGAALLGLLPGLPLAGGWLLVALFRWFSVETERATAVADLLGLALVLGLLLAGGSTIIGGGDWMLALGLLALAWALREGATVVEGRVLAGEILGQMTAGAVMQRPVAVVGPDNNLAEVFHRQTYGTARVLPVQDPKGMFLGLLPLDLADRLLQGTWPRISVASVMVPATVLPAVLPDTPLPRVLDILGHNPPAKGLVVKDSDDPEVGYVPVIEQGRLRGVIGWDEVSEYERLAAEAGVQEAAALEEETDPGWRRFAWLTLLFGGLVAVVILSAVGARMIGPQAQAGTHVLDPSAGQEPIQFASLSPDDGALVQRGALPISIAIRSKAPVKDVAILLDGEPLAVLVNPPGGTEVTASAAGFANMLGMHTLAVSVTADGGLTGQTHWTIHVVSESPGSGSGEATPAPAATPATDPHE